MSAQRSEAMTYTPLLTDTVWVRTREPLPIRVDAIPDSDAEKSVVSFDYEQGGKAFPTAFSIAPSTGGPDFGLVPHCAVYPFSQDAEEQSNEFFEADLIVTATSTWEKPYYQTQAFENLMQYMVPGRVLEAHIDRQSIRDVMVSEHSQGIENPGTGLESVDHSKKFIYPLVKGKDGVHRSSIPKTSISCTWKVMDSLRGTQAKLEKSSIDLSCEITLVERR